VKIIASLPEIYRQAAEWKGRGLRIALVPTMGCLHEGHLSLMRQAAAVADRIIVSIFVNPMQFGPNEDYDSYPRQFRTDCQLAENEGVHAVFSPDPKDMYGESFQTKISVTSLSRGMCGAGRPGHFDGVATVVTKLFHLTLADVAVFGQKDYQQLAIIRRLVLDLNMHIEIIGFPIVREQDGLAMSSRNKYLQGESRKQALCLHQAIRAAQKLVAESPQQVSAEAIISQTGRIIGKAGANLEYAVVIDESTLQNESVITPESVLAIAARIGGTVRLIDNARLIPESM
jgi:pantoate--beta-alanine ligase